MGNTAFFKDHSITNSIKVLGCCSERLQRHRGKKLEETQRMLSTAYRLTYHNLRRTGTSVLHILPRNKHVPVIRTMLVDGV